MTLRHLSILLIAALPLCAQDAALGLQANAMLPMSDLQNLTSKQVGFGAHVFIEFPVGEGLLLRPTVGAQYIPKGDTLDLAGSKTDVTSVDMLLDGLWFPGEDPKHGPYLVGSIGGQHWRISTSGSTSATTSATRLGLAGGIGYQFSPHLGMEVKGFWSPIEKDLTATGLTAGASWRF